jgi:hypothetical protein
MRLKRHRTTRAAPERDNDIRSLGGGEQYLPQPEDGGLHITAVCTDEGHLVVFEGKPQVSRVGRIVEAEAARGARRHRQHGILLAVHQDVVALAAIHLIDHLVRRNK